MDVKLNNGSFEVLFDNKAGLRGTYTTAAGNTVITFIVNEVYGDYLNDDEEEIWPTFESKWYNKNQVLDVWKKWVKEVNPNLTNSEISDWLNTMSAALDAEYFTTEIGTIDGNTMIDGDGNTFTKTTGSSGNGGNQNSGGSTSLAGTTWRCTDSSSGIPITITLTFTASTVRMEYSMMEIDMPPENGTYKLNGSSLTINWDAGYEGSGSYSVSGNKLTSGEGYIFTKQ